MLCNKKYLLLCSIIICCLNLASCSQPKAKLSPLTVRYFDGASFEESSSTFYISEYFSVSIHLENINKVCIIFPYDFGAKIYYGQNGNMHEVANLMEYVPHDDITIDARGGFFAGKVLSFTPDIENLSISKPTDFIVRISGAVCKSGEVFSQEIPFTIAPQ